MKITLTEKDKEFIQKVYLPLLQMHVEAFREVQAYRRAKIKELKVQKKEI